MLSLSGVVQCGYFAQIRNTKRSSGRLREMLLEHNLAIPLCVLIAQQRHAIVYGQKQGDADDKRPIKLTGKLYDQAQDTLVQFVTFLSTQLTLDEFQQHLPTMDQLLTTCHIGTEAAFALWRPVYMHAITVGTLALYIAQR
jgi:THO complex subunit 2